MKRISFVLFSLILFGVFSAFAQTRTIKGVVISSEDNDPLFGVNVVLDHGGKITGTRTDADGKFTISVPSDAKTLRFSLVGMVAKTLPISSEMKVVLDPNVQELDEVIVVAYGTAKKSSFTGSASSVGKKQLEMRPISNVTQAIAGSSPGVQVTTGSGQPGTGLAIRIRGFGSVNASSAPLYVVDGAPYSGSIADMNPADIENITLLKDAASTSLYGSSAGNGVVLITTKKGRSNERKPIIKFTSSFGTSVRGIPEYERVGLKDYYPVMWKQLYNSYIYKDSEPLNPADAAALASVNVFKELRYNPFKGVKGEEIVGADGKLNPNATTLLYGDDTDWAKAVTRNAVRQEYGVSINHQGEKSDSYASVSYLKDQGYAISSNYERFSGRLNANFRPLSFFKTGINMSAFSTKSDFVGDGASSYINPFYFSRNIGPIYPIHLHDDETGEYILDSEGNKIYDYLKSRGKGASSGRHIIAETEYNFENNSRNGLNSRIYADVDILPELKFTTNLSYDNTNYLGTKYMNRIVGDAKDKGSLSKTNNRSTTITFNQLLKYNKTINDTHNLDVLLGHENYMLQIEQNSSTKGLQILDGIYEYGNFITPESLSSATIEYKKEGYFGRLDYNYDNKYYASFSYRKDGTSRFHKNARWGDFWSVGTSWRIAQENFMKNVSWVDDLKLRASYGQTGNDMLLSNNSNVYYAYQTLYAIGWNNHEQPGILFAKLGNPELKWETQVSSDVALEFSLFRRIRGSLELFKKESKDLLFSLPIPPSSGITSISSNLGKIRNTGIEFDIHFDLVKSKDFNWSLGFNTTHLKNVVVELPETSKEIMAGTKKITEGHSLYDFWLKQYAGVDPKDGMALYVLDNSLDANNKRKFAFDEKDCRIINGDTLTTNSQKANYAYNGSSIPLLYGGFNTFMSYKGFELSANFTYQYGGKTYDGVYQSLMGMDNQGGSIHIDAMNKSWKQEGDITDTPRLDAGKVTDFGSSSDRWLISSNALMLKSLVMGYNLPKSLLSKAQINNAKITLSGENLFLLSKRKGLNPMANYGGTTGNTYSASRSYSIGLQLTF